MARRRDAALFTRRALHTAGREPGMRFFPGSLPSRCLKTHRWGLRPAARFTPRQALENPSAPTPHTGHTKSEGSSGVSTVTPITTYGAATVYVFFSSPIGIPPVLRSVLLIEVPGAGTCRILPTPRLPLQTVPNQLFLERRVMGAERNWPPVDDVAPRPPVGPLPASPPRGRGVFATLIDLFELLAQSRT